MAGLCAVAMTLLLAGAAESSALAAEQAGETVATAPRLVVVPLGDPASDLVEWVAESVRSRLLIQVEIADPVPLAPSAWYAPRKRWRAEVLLDQLDALDLNGARHVIGVTEAPISTTKGDRYDWGIAGLGQLPGKSCVLTAYLFRRFKRADRKRYLRYMENLVLHELGHTLGLDHCSHERCIMADAKGNAIRAARLSINEFCPRCHRQIQHWLRAPTVQGQWSTLEGGGQPSPGGG